jgi:voltage-gated sodium channel
MSYDTLTEKIRQIVSGGPFQRVVVSVIVFSAILLGVETNRELVDTYGHVLKFLDRAVLSFFVVEILLKILSFGRKPGRYFLDGWNVADLIIVGACLLPASPGALAVFRLVRILRVLRLITALPKLQAIITGLFKSIPSMGYVVVLLAIHFYMFAILGTFLFRDNDPVHFGNLATTFVSLFQVLTLEGWADIMRTQIYGCDLIGYDNMKDLCVKPMAQPLAAPIYFISFIIIGTMIILNLLIGVVVNGMSDASQPEEAESEKATLETVLKEVKALRSEIRELRDR